MYPIHAGPIGCTMLVLWSHKYKVGHIDLILIKHQISYIHLKFLNFHVCHISMFKFYETLYCILMYVFWDWRQSCTKIKMQLIGP